MTVFRDGDPVGRALDDALEALDNGHFIPESSVLDYKEEPGRRNKKGELLGSASENEEVATFLASEVACMANSDDGGVLIFGVADDGHVIGTDVSAEWLHLRIYELLQKKVNCIITEHTVQGKRVLAIRVPESAEPVTYRKKLRWRVFTRCESFDPVEWYRRKQIRAGQDWSAQSSGIPADKARAAALEIARGYLRASGDPADQDLADASNIDLLRRLNVVDGDGILRNAGALLFIGRSTPALDYVRRDFFGGDSKERINDGGVSLLEELEAVFGTARAYNPEIHVENGLQVSRYRALPDLALREAIVNGVIHREWVDLAPTWIEHVGNTLRVTSPGGFFGGVSPSNIINHPPHSRNPILSEAFAKLRIAERQGIGVDRLYGEMLRLGHREPEFTEDDQARVLVVLSGDAPDTGWITWLRSIGEPAYRDLRLLMALRRLATQGWTDARDLQPYLQVTEDEAEVSVDKLLALSIDGEPTVVPLHGTPSGSDIALTLSAAAREKLNHVEARIKHPEHVNAAKSYAKHRGRISTTELASIMGGSAPNMGTYLMELEEEGILAPSRPSRRGPGFHYIYAGP